MRLRVNNKRRTVMSKDKKKPWFKWYEKLSMYFVGFVVIVGLIIIGDIKDQREVNEKREECLVFLENNPT
jgi:cytoskeletal protein RodZ